MCFLLISWSSKNGNFIVQSLHHVDVNLKPRFLIKSGYYIVPSPSTTLELHSECKKNQDDSFFTRPMHKKTFNIQFQILLICNTTCTKECFWGYLLNLNPFAEESHVCSNFLPIWIKIRKKNISCLFFSELVKTCVYLLDCSIKTLACLDSFSNVEIVSRLYKFLFS